MKSKILGSLKNMVFEETDPKQSDAPASNAGVVPVIAVPTVVYNAVAGTPLDDESEKVYQKILGETSFDKTATSVTIHKYLDPLASLAALDEHTRFKTAFLQARAQDGLSAEKVLGTFDGLKVALSNEQKEFDAAAQETEQQDIGGRQKEVKDISETIAQKQAEIAQLTQQLATVSTELTTAQTKIQRARSQFASAANRRSAELDNEKAKYVDLLKGL